VLVLASVLGREFSLRALARLAGLGEDDLLDILDSAVASRVIVDAPGSPGRLRFSHVVVRDTLYEELTATRRVRLHRLVIEALEELYGANVGQHFAELAYHSTAGGDFERALRYARLAGDWALSSLGYEEAARQYETALDALELSRPGDERTRLELLLALAESEIRAGDSATAKPIFLEAAEIARRLGLPREMARAAVGYGGRLIFERASGDERLVPLFEAALGGLGDEDLDLRVRLLARLAGALRDEHLRVRRDALSAEAVDLARQSGDSAVLAFALDGRASAIQAPDTLEECLGLGTELLELSLQLGDTERVVHAHNHRFIAQLHYCDIRAAEAELDASSQIAEELGQPAQLWLTYAAKALLALAAGRFSEAADLMPTAYDFGKRAQEMAESVYLFQRYALCDFRGDLDEIARELEALAARHPARPVLRCALAHVHLHLELTAKAESELEALAADDYAVLPFDLEWLHAASMLSEVCARVGATNPAAVLYSQLAPWAHLNVVNVFEGSRGSVHRYLALLAATTGRSDDARGHFGKAIEINERMGARPWLARSQEEYGRMLLTSNDPADCQRGSALLAQSAATFHDLGMDRFVAR